MVLRDDLMMTPSWL